jgi:hypothetical protein
MRRLIAAAVVIAGTMAGPAWAQERNTAANTVRSSESAAPASARRCSGVDCLRYVPSLGVGY